MPSQLAAPRITQQGVLTIVENGVRLEEDEVLIHDRLLEEIKGRDPILFKGVFDRSLLRSVRRGVAEYPYRHSDYADNGAGFTANFSRRDVFPPWTKPSGRPYDCRMQYFFFFPWNENPDGVDQLVRAVARLRNQLAGDPAETALVPENDEVFFGTFTHYPTGGGFCDVHHWYTPAEAAAVPPFNENLVLFTRYGEDYRSGGLYLWKEDQVPQTYAEPLLEPGDVLCLTSTVGHQIRAVDSDNNLDWDPLKGRLLLWVGKGKVSGLRGFASQSPARTAA